MKRGVVGWIVSIAVAFVGGLIGAFVGAMICLLYTSDAADERSSVDLGGRRIIKKKKKIKARGGVAYKKKLKKSVIDGRTRGHTSSEEGIVR